MERKGVNQKQKLLYLQKIFMEETDEEHGLTMAEIKARLHENMINADRKTLYVDFDELRSFGLDIIPIKVGRDTIYKLASREFELPELKLLVDAVQSSRFITDKKSEALIQKLEGLVSQYEGKQLHRQVIISGRIKSMNESIYYNVDRVHSAISSNVQIRFKYFQWNLNKEAEPRRNGKWYEVSPWALLWENEYYYLIAYDSQEERIKHFRVDKMLDISLTENEREGQDAYDECDMPQYTQGLFGMFGGDPANVTLEAENSLVGVFIDRFGSGIPITAVGNDRFRTTVKVSLSNQFLGWVMALGSSVRIISPDSVVESMRNMVSQLRELYES